MITRTETAWSLPGLRIRKNILVAMRDGVTLATDVYLSEREGPHPALLLRTPYDKDDATEVTYAHATWYAQRGFAVVVQDVRGRWASGGEFEPFAHEAADGHDTIAWIAAQPWCTGRVASYGFSYPGASQMLAAADAPEALAAMVPAMTGSSYHEGWTYRGGTFELAFILSWVAALARDQAIRAGDHVAAEELSSLAAAPESLYATLPLRTALPEVLMRHAPYLAQWLAHPTYDSYWRALAPSESYARMRLPALHVGGWYDSFLTGTVDNYTALDQAGHARQRLIIGPWFHMPWSQHVKEVDFGWDGHNLVDDAQLAFFSRTLGLGRGDEDAAPVELFVMGENRWSRFPCWPPAGVSRSLFLSSDGRANSLSGTGRLSVEPSSEAVLDAMACSPLAPVVSTGGRSCCVADTAPMGAADQRGQEIRNDVLVYSSEILETGMRVIGQPKVTLYVATDTPSADIILRLNDVPPDGRSITVSDGVYRLPAGEADRGKVTKVEIAMSPTAVRFQKGHRIRLTVAGSDFPARDRNPNNGVRGLEATWSDFRVATVAVLHGPDRPSAIALPTA